MEENKEPEKQKICLPESVTVKEFSQLMGKSVSEVIAVLMENGFLATINESLDLETATIIAEDLGFEVSAEEKEEIVEPQSHSDLAELIAKDETDKKALEVKSPVVTILGHVDHGKTTLLDTIRKTKVVDQESGGITQHITAYQVKVKNKKITFIDTPGHAAFDKMRSRGAGIADVAIIIIDVCDGVKPQTKEVVEKVLKSQMPFLICFNKIDKAGADPERVKGQLAELGVLVEGWGGTIPLVLISAKENRNIDELLETVLLVAEMEDLKVNPTSPAIGLVLESHLDKNRGPVATLIVKSGTLNVGDFLVAGRSSGRIKLIEDYKGKSIKNAPPSTPITVLGLNQLPESGSIFQTKAKQKNCKKEVLTANQKNSGNLNRSPLKRIEKSLKKERYKKLNIVIKADTEGSLEAIEQILNTLVTSDVVIKVVKAGVGQIIESDIIMAGISDALLYGFRVAENSGAKEAEEKNKIKPRMFDVIYHLVDDIKKEMEKNVTMEEVRSERGSIKILAVFKTGKKDMIVGGRITEGKLVKGDFVDIIREGEIVGQGKISEVKRGKESVSEATEGDECGMNFEPIGAFNKIKEDDKLAVYTMLTQTKTIE